MVHRVLRDRLGELEDRFFATVFLGSGLLFLAMPFASAAVGGGIVIAYGWRRPIARAKGSFALLQKEGLTNRACSSNEADGSMLIPWRTSEPLLLSLVRRSAAGRL
jgi:hypothetical protein